MQGVNQIERSFFNDTISCLDSQETYPAACHRTCLPGLRSSARPESLAFCSLRYDATEPAEPARYGPEIRFFCYGFWNSIDHRLIRIDSLGAQILFAAAIHWIESVQPASIPHDNDSRGR